MKLLHREAGGLLRLERNPQLHELAVSVLRVPKAAADKVTGPPYI